jgi:hypothetical protein
MMEPDTRRFALPLTGPIFRIVVAAALATGLAAQTKPSAQKKSQAATRTASHAAQVTYSGGQLSVVANNNSLAETLAEIRNVTKAKVEGVQPGVAERISGEFGPDTPRAVVGALLANSHYNFILVSPPGNPGSLQRIVLSEPAPEPIAAAQQVSLPATQPASAPQSDEVAKPPAEAEIPIEPNRMQDAAAKDEPQHRDSAVAEKDPADTATEVAPAKEIKSDGDTPAAPSTDSKRANHDDQPTVPATVEICGVKYDGSQLENVKVPDHCGKPTQQPNSANGSK